MRVWIILAFIAVLAGQAVGEPIQLIYPDADHRFLLINETACKVVEMMDMELGVVAAAGPVRSGKSWLLNQIMRQQQKGFVVGSTVNPMTRGLWAWSEPIELLKTEANQKVKEQEDNQDDDEGMSLIEQEQEKTTPISHTLFLDTEGMAASDTNELYDAKIFSVATFLSSVFLFNSIKIIDQASIDAVELLARRTQLFGIRAVENDNITTSTNHTNNKTLEYPEFVWVAQDFVTNLGEHATANTWLQSLLEKPHHRVDTAIDGQQHRTSLTDIFPSVHCRTMFIPHTDKTTLENLNTVTSEAELTPAYVRDLSDLRSFVITLLHHKKKTTGTGLMALLRFLVHAVNQQEERKMFPAVPNFWHEFMVLQMQLAKEDCFLEYRTTNTRVLQDSTKVMTDQEFHVQETKAANQALWRLQNMLKGWDTTAISKELELAISTRLRPEFLGQHAAQVRRLLTGHAATCVHELRLALKVYHHENPLANSTVICSQHERLLVQLLVCFSPQAKYKGNTAYERIQTEELGRPGQELSQHHLAEARRRITSKLWSLEQEAQKEIRQQKITKPLGVRNASIVHASLALSLNQTFLERSLPWREEASFPEIADIVVQSIESMRQHLLQENVNLAYAECERMAKECSRQFEKSLTQLALPFRDEDTLFLAFTKTQWATIDVYDAALVELVDHSAYYKFRSTIVSEDSKETLALRNLASLRMYFNTPVHVTVQEARYRAKEYSTVFAFRREMRQALVKAIRRYMEQDAQHENVLNLDSTLAEKWLEHVLKTDLAAEFSAIEHRFYHLAWRWGKIAVFSLSCFLLFFAIVYYCLRRCLRCCRRCLLSPTGQLRAFRGNHFVRRLVEVD